MLHMYKYRTQKGNMIEKTIYQFTNKFYNQFEIFKIDQRDFHRNDKKELFFLLVRCVIFRIQNNKNVVHVVNIKKK